MLPRIETQVKKTSLSFNVIGECSRKLLTAWHQITENVLWLLSFMMKSWEGSKNTTISQSNIYRRNQCSRYMPKKNNNKKKDHSEINQIRITKPFFFNRGKTILWKDMFQHPCKLAKMKLNFSSRFGSDMTVLGVWLCISIPERKVKEEK